MVVYRTTLRYVDYTITVSKFTLVVDYMVRVYLVDRFTLVVVYLAMLGYTLFLTLSCLSPPLSLVLQMVQQRIQCSGPRGCQEVYQS